MNNEGVDELAKEEQSFIGRDGQVMLLCTAQEVGRVEIRPCPYGEVYSNRIEKNTYELKKDEGHG
jgi:hypothetical protein